MLISSLSLHNFKNPSWKLLIRVKNYYVFLQVHYDACKIENIHSKVVTKHYCIYVRFKTKPGDDCSAFIECSKSELENVFLILAENLDLALLFPRAL